MWIELLTSLSQDVRFEPPASEVAIRDCERALGNALDEDLVALLRQANGVTGEYGLDLIWPVERIAADNAMFRTSEDFAELYMPFDPLLFFADAGNGDQFAFVLRPERKDVFAWDHESDSRTWVAPNLEMYLTWMLEGRIEL